ncbi:hypothetical protein DE146DRAFT_637655 [Phaeosphaeria sp. MPI-PUGE-AT-0046c]|nr:hypothetical protein DE146DRAFT_637655 [Phaeosphaeria sp. MPI-PUGE-AT-0046c]
MAYKLLHSPMGGEFYGTPYNGFQSSKHLNYSQVFVSSVFFSVPALLLSEKSLLNMLATIMILSAVVVANFLLYLGYISVSKARTLIRAHRKETAELVSQLCNTRILLGRAETKLMSTKAELACRRCCKNNTSAPVKELEYTTNELHATRVELAEANKRHRKVLVNVAELERKIKEGKKTMCMVVEASKALREELENSQKAFKNSDAELKASQDQVENLQSVKLLNHNQLATYTQQLRAANAENWSLKAEIVTLQELNHRHEREKHVLGAQLSSERADNMDLTQQIRFKANELHEMTIQLESQQAREELLIGLIEAQDELRNGLHGWDVLDEEGVEEEVMRSGWEDEDAWIRDGDEQLWADEEWYGESAE